MAEPRGGKNRTEESAHSGSPPQEGRPQKNGHQGEGGGVPARLDCDVIAKIAPMAAAGVPRRFIHSTAGVSRRTFDEWVNRGRRLLTDAEYDLNRVPRRVRPYARLAQTLDDGESRFGQILALSISRGVRDDHRFALDVAARLHPEVWGRRDPREQTGHENCVTLDIIRAASAQAEATRSERARLSGLGGNMPYSDGEIDSLRDMARQ